MTQEELERLLSEAMHAVGGEIAFLVPTKPRVQQHMQEGARIFFNTFRKVYEKKTGTKLNERFTWKTNAHT